MADRLKYFCLLHTDPCCDKCSGYVSELDGMLERVRAFLGSEKK